MKGSDETRFFARVVEEGDCWRWTGSFSNTGYGSFSVPSTDSSRSHRTTNAHRWAYQYLISSEIAELKLDHLCRNRWCVNPWHLDPVTDLVNARRGNGGKHWRDKTHCPQGHPYSGGNLGDGRRSSGATFRFCKTCNGAASRVV